MKFLKRLLGVMSPVHIAWVQLTRRGRYMGDDPFGNKYYEAAPRPGYKLTRRWVIYKGAPEATKVPPEWHGWLHHQQNEFPDANTSTRRNWQKAYIPNMTGTTEAWRPPGHLLEGGKRDKATGDYEAWQPPE